jgi:hypothetical protein
LTRLVTATLILLGFGGAAAARQTEKPVVKIARGVVSRFVGDSQRPFEGAKVVLHSVGPRAAYAMDSTLSGARGEFRFRFEAAEKDSAYYFVSSSHSGIAYFSHYAPFHAVDTAKWDVTVYDTTSSEVAVAVAGRLIMLLPPVLGGDRGMGEILAVANDGLLTRVPGRDSIPVWSTSIPVRARDFKAALEMLNPDALRFTHGQLQSFAPLSPGLRDIKFSYVVPEDAFPLTLPLAEGVEILEVLVKEPSILVRAPGLQDLGQVVHSDGEVYHGFQALDVPAGAELIITLPEGSALKLTHYLALVVLIVGTGMLITLAVAFRKRPSPVAAVPAARSVLQSREADDLARRIADIDVRREQTGDESTRAALATERERLKVQLATMLARGSGPTARGRRSGGEG